MMGPESLTYEEVKDWGHGFPKGTLFIAITLREQALLNRAMSKLDFPKEWTNPQVDVFLNLAASLGNTLIRS